MPPDADGTAPEQAPLTFVVNGLQYAYDAELSAVLPFNEKIPFDNIAEACRRRSQCHDPTLEIPGRAPSKSRRHGAGPRHSRLPLDSPELAIRTYTPARRAIRWVRWYFFMGGLCPGNAR